MGERPAAPLLYLLGSIICGTHGPHAIPQEREFLQLYRRFFYLMVFLACILGTFFYPLSCLLDILDLRRDRFWRSSECCFRRTDTDKLVVSFRFLSHELPR
jgi:hypothetical protein